MSPDHSAQKTNINPEILQQMLDSASNAAEKGQSQFFTPIDFGRQVSAALPRSRPAVVDLTCGNGQLLHASALPTTRLLYGADIDPCRFGSFSPEGERPAYNFKKISHDLTLLYPILQELGARADCLVLNPPWHLFWHRDRLTPLAESALPAVRDAFAAVEPGTPKGAIDSTIATLMIALDLCTVYGEGLLIANNNTLERLILGDGGRVPAPPFAALAKHIWAHLVIPGNPMTGINDCLWEKDQEFHTGVIYFARDHTVGPRRVDLRQLEAGIRQYRHGAQVRGDHEADATLPDLWQAARERVAELEGARPRLPYNLWLTASGRIRTGLSLFQSHSRKIDKRAAERLRALDGKAPMELVLQRNTRDNLLDIAERGGWRVEPALTAAIRAAVQDYHGGRAPLYPLPKIQRLGYLDEQDHIDCERDLASAAGHVAFVAGRKYPLRTQTVQVTRTVLKPNAMTGEGEELEFTGQQLAIYIQGEPDPRRETETPKPDPKNAGPQTCEFCFMDATINDDMQTKVTTARQVKQAGDKQREQIDFTLQQLCDHFTIPEVPDVATVNPEGYNANLKLLEELEALCP